MLWRPGKFAVRDIHESSRHDHASGHGGDEEAPTVMTASLAIMDYIGLDSHRGLCGFDFRCGNKA